MSESQFDVAQLSAMDQAAFVAALEGIFEHSPWIARRAWAQRPYADRAGLLAALVAEMWAATAAEQHALIAAHPELAGKAAVRGELTAESTSEQRGAGLDSCTPAEFARLQELNAAYRARFGIPFVVAVRGRDRAAILAALEARLGNSVEAEVAEALRQIERIAALRLENRVAP
ncbi:2-oxo-4-hydroxy-4-carboxy-5-ureidoimidazoline decarboxylase [Niveibacterium sp. SC-1]|uniref:2-oxo-4-hydroxy-4-carboxy-5-ureidoimidazoline decarboxylase n=1 Tax=Niveibacterium sp. SC-1 TaxID=3135646 RepID=UPI00311DE47F